jgi:hypothetical protein
VLNKEQAHKVGPLVNNPQAWEALTAYLQDLHQVTLRGLVTAQSEREMYQLQGKMVLLETLLNLNNNHKKVIEENGRP